MPGLSAIAAAPAVAGERGFLGKLFAAMRVLLRPAALYARSVPLVQFDPIGGLGGTVGNFGDNPTGTVDPLPGQIAYVTSDWATSTFDEIHVINTDSTGDTRLTNDPGRHDWHPAWSPDGGRIAFVAYPVQCDSEGATVGCEAVHVMNADGSAVVRVLWEWEHGDTELNAIRDLDWITDPGDPESRLLGFTAGADYPRGRCIYQTDLNRAAPWGGGVTLALSDNAWREWPGADGECLLSSALGWDLRVVGADWGKDSTFVMAGRRIDYEVCDSGGVSYRCNAPEGPENLFTSKWDGSGLRTLVASPADMRAPTWSPDGTRIAFVEVIAGSSRGDVMVLEVGSGVVMRLTADGMAEPSALTWSPDGAKLAFARLQAAPVHCAGQLIADIYVISAADGSSPGQRDELGSGAVRLELGSRLASGAIEKLSVPAWRPQP